MMRQNLNLKPLKVVGRIGYGELRNYNAENSLYIHFFLIIPLDSIKNRMTRVDHHHQQQQQKNG